tara:strand:- start:254 stop:655 length:402 start_codon:yes stop_codon:yes gene_type:complete
MIRGDEGIGTASFYVFNVGSLTFVDMDYTQSPETPCQALKGVAASLQMKTMPPLPGPDRLTQDAGPYGIAGTSRPLKKYAEQLARIESALARMEAGNYGLCTNCESRIALTRLKADPAIATCADCKEPENLTV